MNETKEVRINWGVLWFIGFMFTIGRIGGGTDVDMNFAQAALYLGVVYALWPLFLGAMP